MTNVLKEYEIFLDKFPNVKIWLDPILNIEPMIAVNWKRGMETGFQLQIETLHNSFENSLKILYKKGSQNEYNDLRRQILYKNRSQLFSGLRCDLLTKEIVRVVKATTFWDYLLKYELNAGWLSERDKKQQVMHFVDRWKDDTWRITFKNKLQGNLPFNWVACWTQIRACLEEKKYQTQEKMTERIIEILALDFMDDIVLIRFPVNYRINKAYIPSLIHGWGGFFLLNTIENSYNLTVDLLNYSYGITEAIIPSITITPYFKLEYMIAPHKKFQYCKKRLAKICCTGQI